jgi:hypothetical protein
MADNVAITAGSGTSIAADDISSVFYQRVKISHGADGSATDTSSAAPLPVGTLLKITSVDLSTPTGALADGDVMADSQIVNACLRAVDGTGTIINVTAIDDADQGFGIDLFFLDANVSIGTEDAAPSISDANAANILGWLRIAAADWIDLGGVRIASVPCSIPVKGVSGDDAIYVAAVARGAGTWAGGTDVTLRIAIACD